MATNPYDILKAIVTPDIAGNFARGYQAGALPEQLQTEQAIQKQQLATAQTADLAKQAALQRQQLYQQQVGKVLANPTPDGYRTLMLQFPEEHETLAAGAKSYNDDQKDRNVQAATEVYGLLQNGNNDAALSKLQARRTALANGGESTEVTDQLISDIQSGDPARIKQAQGLAGYALSGLLGDKAPDVLATLHKDTTDQATAPFTVAKAKADASTATTEAQFAPQKAATDISNIQSQIDDRAARLGLDRDKLTTDTQIELDKIDQSRLSDGAKTKVNELVMGSASSNQFASRLDSVAQQFADLPKGTGSGGLSGLNELVKQTFGNQNDLSLLRGEYQQLVTQQAIKNLPPGPASDNDVKQARKGFPSPNADRDTIVSFLRGMSKLQVISANAQQSQADWIASNGSLAPLQRDATINGVRVPAGSNYADFLKSGSATQARNAAVQPTRSRYGL